MKQEELSNTIHDLERMAGKAEWYLKFHPPEMYFGFKQVSELHVFINDCRQFAIQLSFLPRK